MKEYTITTEKMNKLRRTIRLLENIEKNNMKAFCVKDDTLFHRLNNLIQNIDLIYADTYMINFEYKKFNIEKEYIELKKCMSDEQFKSLSTFLITFGDNVNMLNSYFQKFRININKYSPILEIKNLIKDFLIENKMLSEDINNVFISLDKLYDILIYNIFNKSNINITHLIINKECNYDYFRKSFFPYIQLNFLLKDIDIPNEIRELIDKFNNLRDRLET